ncbi:hypothetical protein HPP92_020286 [Vanilla planifolia]|uniref:EndoU domain-containing protein n=1 Tax=Vanilla planifolia TaxID=51239 RepID=A0A835PWT5_VANPL|nr:hypothetical protein HPP92_020688 [Vanilla planifolia]KAG0461810.1 hypothetical protein HPP92_020286 [Vanilla planifolia]
MEGLIKGVAELAFGFVEGGGEEQPERQSSTEIEERSRSTWAERLYARWFLSGSTAIKSRDRGAAMAYRPATGPQGRKRKRRRRVALVEIQARGNQGRNGSIWRMKVKRVKMGIGKLLATRGDILRGHIRFPRKIGICSSWLQVTRNTQLQHMMVSTLNRQEQSFLELSKACNRLWELDLNRLVPGKDYELDVGEGKRVYQKGDMASGNLFKWLNDDVLRRPTYARFCSLLDNYNPQVGYKEVVTPEEKHEQAAFIQEISRTLPIKYLHKYLVEKGILSESYDEFKEFLTHLWFDLYSRGGESGSSSAFEHVFVGEIKGQGDTSVTGFHNWIQFYLEEAKGNVDYQGYILPRHNGEQLDAETQLLTIQFEWNGVLKSLSSTLIGVSPEFEIALYTLCFYVGREDNHVRLGPYSVNIKCYHMGQNKIGSAFPMA